jgi:serine/threonine protein kinase
MRRDTLDAGILINDRYKIGRVLGQGGFGITYLGKDMKYNRIVAIKEFFLKDKAERHDTELGEHFQFCQYGIFCSGREHRQLYETCLRNFIKEAQTLAKFAGYPGIVTVHDLVVDNFCDGTAYIIMEYVQGYTLGQLLKKNKAENRQMTEQQMLILMRPLIESLSKIHQTGFIHRDIAPDNIILQKNNTLKLIDFGAALQFQNDFENRNNDLPFIRSGYAPLEQYEPLDKNTLGPWSDVYSLCATIFNMLEKKPISSPDDRLQQGMKIEPLSQPLSQRTFNALMHGLEIFPKNRTQNCRELLRELYG